VCPAGSPVGTQRERTVTTLVTPLNGGKACPPNEFTDCEVEPCTFTWMPWGTCDPSTGTQERSTFPECAAGGTCDTSTGLIPPTAGGTPCPGPETRPCDVDCTSTWNPWTQCNTLTGIQTRDLTITTACYPNNCPNGHLNGGSNCGVPESRNCDVPCAFSWPAWGVCNKTTGEQHRSPTITVTAVNNADPCPGPDTRTCNVDCEFQFNPWSQCSPTLGTQSRTITVQVEPLNGGESCPGPEERTCPVDCVYTWEPWQTCREGDGTQIRDPLITTPMLNGGAACPAQEERDCSVDCQYQWSDWGVCGSAGKGLHERTVIIDTPCYPLNNCPTGHLLTGVPCPPKEQKTCMVDCVSTHDPWTTCDINSGKQNRSVTITVQPFAGGSVCLAPEERPCKVDCVIAWDPWQTCDKATGRQTRQHNIVIETNTIRSNR